MDNETDERKLYGPKFDNLCEDIYSKEISKNRGLITGMFCLVSGEMGL